MYMGSVTCLLGMTFYLSSFKVGNGKNKNGVVLARHVTLKGKTFLNLYDVDKNIQVQLKSWPKVLDGSARCLELRSSFQDWEVNSASNLLALLSRYSTRHEEEDSLVCGYLKLGHCWKRWL